MTGSTKEAIGAVSFAAMLCLYRNNIASEVEEALHSAFDLQDTPPSQLIVVFDGFVPDDIMDVIEQFSLTHDVQRVVHDECLGHGKARAAALDACQYDWIAIIDADDVSMPNRFSDLCDVINLHPQTAVVGGGLVEFQMEDGEKVFGSTVNYPTTPEDVRRYLATRSPIAQPTAMLRVKAIKDVGNYMDWYNNEDYHLWIRLVTSGYELRNAQEPVLWFRTNPDLFSRRGGFKYWLNEVRLQVFSYRRGATTLGKLILGANFRFMVQVLMTPKIRAIFYKKVLR